MPYYYRKCGANSYFDDVYGQLCFLSLSYNKFMVTFDR